MIQYIRNILFSMISTGTPRLRTDRSGNDFGGICGSKYDSNKAIAANEFNKKMNLSKIPNRFI
ncbi:hypothetical protein [Christiangramia salexigens]|uniref:hypothetical protein n=1 Tax=Christiangramia salexigens TaxID=1913577 RepID=UPI001E6579C9|nr:hypothetical protein [Christiangramia salexigens]